jgi:RES domain-containing protein
MYVWRICKARYAESALSGEGARLFAGRWNRQGVPVVYTSRSLALAAVELFVHLDPSNAPADLVSLCIEIPSRLKIDRVQVEDLPALWRRMDSDRLREIGGSWVASMRSVGLEVPSAAIDGEWNVLLNPAHPDFRHVTNLKAKAFLYDERMFRR